jgi:oligoendopeptidase F
LLYLKPMYSADIQKLNRNFLPQSFTVNTWLDIQPYINQLMQAELSSLEQLEAWLLQISELQAALSEDSCWRQIKMTCDTTDKKLEEAFTYWCTEIQPQLSTATDSLNKKLMACPYTQQLDKEKYGIYLRSVQNAIALYHEANVALQSEESILAQQFGVINSQMSIELDGNTYTLQQAVTFLQQNDRALRERVYNLIATRRLQDKDALDELMDKLLKLRHQIAVNAGFHNYRDYKFKELGRFDYTVDDCTQFHNAIKESIIPLCTAIYNYKKNRLGLDTLKPYDVDAEPAGIEPLRPFTNGDDLIEKSIAVFDKLGSFFGDCFRKMKTIKHFDLDSRMGKSPGGYNCPLAETGVPFIFMNAASTADDVVTMMHEGGHAVHSFVAHHLPLSAFKEYPMEIAELASMSMELFSMDHWHLFYDSKEELHRAKAEELERVLTILPWIAIVDKFQHWLYTHPGHSAEERTAAWVAIQNEFAIPVIDYSGYEDYRSNFWQKQLHIFEVPFYYIEYGIAQLGAIGMWMQYKQNPEKALDNYLQALSLGYTKGLKELYQTAGIEFDFSSKKVSALSAFVDQEMKQYL